MYPEGLFEYQGGRKTGAGFYTKITGNAFG